MEAAICGQQSKMAEACGPGCGRLDLPLDSASGPTEGAHTRLTAARSRGTAPGQLQGVVPWHSRAWCLWLMVLMLLAMSSCLQGETKGWGRDMQNRWYAYCLSGSFESRGTLDFFAVSRRKFKKISYSVGEYGPRTVAGEGEKYKFRPSSKGNLYLVWEDGTVQCSAYWMTADEFRQFDKRMEEIEDSDVLQGLRMTLDVKRLDKEIRRFLEIK